MTTRAQDELQWAARWAAAGAALDDIRARELRLLSADEALRAIDDVLSTVTAAEYPAAPRTWSGLVDLQRRLHRPSPR